MANLTAREQLMLELINRARMDPRGEAALLDVTLAKGQGTPVAVLAGNDALRAAAYNHSGWMLLNDIFSRNEVKGSLSFIGDTPLARMQAYGYILAGPYQFGENISWMGHTETPDFTAMILAQHASLFEASGSRARMLNAAYQEAGIGQQAGDFTHDGETYITSMVTQDFIRSGAKVFVTGVIYDDTTGNDFYDVGEGTASRKISAAGAATDRAGQGGGYELQFGATGIKTLTFDLAGPDLALDVALGVANVKVDAVNGREIWTNGSVQSQSAAIRELHALGVSPLVLIGSGAAEIIAGNRAANQLLGLGGRDLIAGGGGGDTIAGGRGADTIKGGLGADVFVYARAAESTAGAPDTIRDFGRGADRIDLSGLVPGKLKYRGGAPIDGANQVRVIADGGDTIVEVNLDGDLAADMRIVLADIGPGALTRGDFLL
jgi:Ca2+-binding RTX toxin-like protein